MEETTDRKNEYLLQGVEAFNRGEMSRAEKLLDQAIELAPTWKEALIIRGQIHYSRGKDRDAIKDLSDAISLDNTQAWAFLLRAYAFRNLGEYHRAIEDVSRALQLDSKQPEAFALRGWLYFRQGWFHSALGDFQIYFRHYPHDVQYRQMYDICRDAVIDPECRITADKYHCARCKNLDCGASLDFSPNPRWEAEKAKCLYHHCVGNAPERPQSDAYCQRWGRECPGGQFQVDLCYNRKTVTAPTPLAAIPEERFETKPEIKALFQFFLTVSAVALPNHPQANEGYHRFGITAESEAECLDLIDQYLLAEGLALREVSKIGVVSFDLLPAEVRAQSSDIIVPGIWFAQHGLF